MSGFRKFFDGKSTPISSTTSTPRISPSQSFDEFEDPMIQLRSDDEIMNSLPNEINNEHFDTRNFILQDLPEQFDEKWFMTQLQEFERALDITNSRLAKKVMTNYNAFVQAMTQIHELGIKLQTSTVVCRNGRRNLHDAKEHLAQKIFGILAKHRRRQAYMKVTENLVTIRKLLETEKKMNQAIGDGDYPLAIKLCVQCRNSLQAYKDFHSLANLENRLQESYRVVQEKLDDSILSICRSFDAVSYKRIIVGYRYLGDSIDVVNRLKQYFLQAINTNTRNTLYAHAVMSEENARRPEAIQRMDFHQVLNALHEDNFLSCLVTIAQVLYDVMYCHYSMVKWHESLEAESENQPSSKAEEPDKELFQYFHDIKEGLVQFRASMWNDIESKVSYITTSPKIGKFKIDEFLKTLDLINKLMDVGSEFSGNDAFRLRDSIKMMSVAYFKNFHKSQMEKLATVLEHDMWEKCPGRIKVSDLKEFRVVKSPTNQLKESAKKGSIFERADETGEHPFANFLTKKRETEEQDEIYSESFSDDELNADEIDEVTGELRKTTPFEERNDDQPWLTTTTINLAKYIGKYFQTMHILQTISKEVFLGVQQIFEYYLYTVFSFFGNGDEESEDDVSPRLRQTIYRLGKQFPKSVEQTDKPTYRVPNIYSGVDLSDPKTVFGLKHRTVGIESLHFLKQAMNELKPFLNDSVQTKYVTDFYYQSVDIIPELTEYMYKKIAMKLANWEQYVSMISNNKWDMKEIPMDFEHSPYVTFLLKEVFDPFSKRIEAQVKSGLVPKRVKQVVFTEVIKLAMEKLVEGYSRAKRCSNEGRAIMSLDLNAIRSGLERLSDIRPIPNVNYVDNYIKAYYLREEDLLEWFKNHPEYSLKHAQNLVKVGVGAQMKKKDRQEILNILEDLDKSRKK